MVPATRFSAGMTDFRFSHIAQTLPSSVPFVGPETQERARGAAFRARLGANENIFGPSPQVIETMADAVRDTWMYGDPESFDLKEALAKHHGISADHLVVGEGIDGLLGYLVRLMLDPGDAVVTSDGAYPTFNYHVNGFGGVLHKVPYRDDAEDPGALVEQARAVDAKLIYLANPDNPMGSWHRAGTIQAMIDALPQGALLVLDEAYIDTAPADAVPDVDPNNPRVIRMRTFSKAYGMAGARVGYAICAPELARAFNKVRNHFGMCRVSQAGALAALADQDYLRAVIAKIAASRDVISEIAHESGLIALPSATNFVTIDCGADGDFAQGVLQALVAQGLFVRMPFVAPQNRCIRVSCGPEPEMALLRQALPQALKTARAG